MEPAIDTGTGIPAAPLIYGFLILWGLVDCFYGYRVLRLTLLLLLVAFGAIIGASIAPLLGAGDLAGMIGGAVTGLVLGIFQNVALGFAGGVFGAMVLSPWIVGLPDLFQLLALIVVCTFTGVLTVWVTVVMASGVTALTGAFRVVFGTYYFLGGPDLLMILSEPRQLRSSIHDETTALFAVALLSAVGFFTQLRRIGAKGE